MKYLITIIFILWTPLHAKIDCSKNTICIETQKKDNNVNFYAINKKSYKITLHLNINSSNMKSKTNLPILVILNGNEKRLITSLSHNNKPWKYNYKYHWARGDYHAKHNNNYIYNLPYKKRNKFKISQSCNGTFTHKGFSQYAIDFSMPISTPIYAAREGIVIDLKNDSNIGGNASSYRNDGNFIFILHDDGTLSEYWHLKLYGTTVRIGQFVKKGEHIGYSGNTGYTRGPHLHFVVKTSNKKGRGVSIPTIFHTNDGNLLCPKKNLYLSH